MAQSEIGNAWKKVQSEVDVCRFYQEGKICKSLGATCKVLEKQICSVWDKEVMPTLHPDFTKARALLGTGVTLAIRGGSEIMASDLQRIATEIQSHLEEAKKAGLSMMGHAIEVGHLLVAAREHFKGDYEFGIWCEQNVGFSRQHRHRFMKLAKLADENPDVMDQVTSWRAAAALWQEQKEPGVVPPRAVAVVEAKPTEINQVQQNQLYLALGFLRQIIGGQVKNVRSTAAKILKMIEDLGPLPETKFEEKSE